MDDLIYNQRSIPKDQWRYGFRSSAATGCGWIATWNALQLMGYKTDIPELIRYYEWQLPLIHGNAGTSFWGPAVCFRKWGFPVEMSFRQDEFDALVEGSDVCILFYYWRRGAKLGAHFIALQKTETGIIGYNTYRSSSGPNLLGPSLKDFLKKQKYFGAVLIGIRKKPD
ncbi:MAG: hypothetical protein IJE81_05310 [Oscillospiraceae bacterium]|nr:hypothetical protein [Oscillospiraceae bacterium]